MIQGSNGRLRREPKDSPQVCLPLKYFREHIKGLTLEQVGARVIELGGRQYGKGTLSAIESGMRGASPEVLDALEHAYELPVGSIKVGYTPRAPRRKADS